MKNKYLLLFGPLAVVVYVLAVVLGGALRPDYSHIAQPVSDLIAAGAANKGLLDALFFLYNLFALAFGIGLLVHVRASRQPGGQTVGWAATVTLMAEAVFGLLTLAFPEDAGGLAAGVGASGSLHIVFAGLSALTSMLALLLMGFWFRRGPHQPGLGWYSFASVAVVFVSGGLSAATVASQSPIGGLLERITIGAFLQWVVVIGWYLYTAEGRPVVQAGGRRVMIGGRG